MDAAATILDAHETDLEDLHGEIALLGSQLEYAENRARRSNIHFRVIPERVTDLQGSTRALLQELVLGIPADRLERNHVRRALTRRQSDGPPRDIVLKFHFLRMKEAVMQAARESQNLSF